MSTQKEELDGWSTMNGRGVSRPCRASLRSRQNRPGEGGRSWISLAQLKRPRDDNVTTPIEHRSDAQLATSIAAALSDAKAGKLTIPVRGGDGLKIPASVPDIFLCTYPPLWWGKVEQGSTRMDLAKDLAKRWDTLRDHLGASFRYSSHRDSYTVHVDNVIASIYLPTAPDSRIKWRSAFANVFGALADIITVSQGAKQASSFEKKVWEQFSSGNLDIEECIRQSEAPEDNKQLQTLDVRALQAQVSALTAKSAALEQQLANSSLTQPPAKQYFRGRGRGRGS